MAVKKFWCLGSLWENQKEAEGVVGHNIEGA